MDDSQHPSDSRSQRLDSLIATVLDAEAQGLASNRQELLDRHPDLAADLAAFFVDHDRMKQLAGPAGSAVDETWLLAPVSPDSATLPPQPFGTEGATSLPGGLPLPPLPGTVVRYFGDYELLEEIARGGMGVVYKARQSRLNRIVALKMILAGLLAGQDEVKRFYTEAEAAAKLDHPGIVPIFEVGQHEGQHYFSMGFVDGQSLAATVAQGPMEPDAAAALVKTVAEAVEYAHHKGVIHRDLKPGNVLLDREGHPRITDFGLAKQVQGDSQLTNTGQILGTPSYMPPEQAAGKINEIGPAADVYALGAILYCLLTGRPPFQSASPMDTLLQVLQQEPVPPRQLNPQTPWDLETIALKCLEKSPARRYASAQELADELERYLVGRPILARPVSRPERLWRWCKRQPRIAALTASVIGLIVLIAAGSLGAALLLRQERNVALSHLDRAERAEQDALDKLWDSYLAQARAGRWSGRMGQRFNSLEALGKAAVMRATPELRDEAIACLALADLRVLKQWKSEPANVPAFDADLNRYAVHDPQGNVTLYNLADNQQLFTLPGPGRPVEWIKRFSPDGRFLAVKYGADGDTVIWNLSSRQKALPVPVKIHLGALDFSPDSRRVAVGTPDGYLWIYELGSGQLRERLGPGPAPYSVAYAPDGRKLAVSSIAANGVTVFDVESPSSLFRLAHPGGVRGLAWGPDGKHLAAACQDSQVYVWDLSAGAPREPTATLKGHQAAATYVCFNHRGDLLASSAWDGTTRLWDPLAGKQLVSAPGEITASDSFSPDDRRLGFINSIYQAGIWEVLPRRECRTLGNLGLPTDISRDGRLGVWCDKSGVRLRDLETGRCTALLPSSAIMSAVFAPDGKSLFTADQVGVHRWALHPEPGPKGPVLHVGPPRTLALPLSRPQLSLSADGKILAACDAAGVHIASVNASGRLEKLLLQGSHPNAASVAVTPDGRWVASGTWKGEGVKIWDTAAGKLLRDLPVVGNASVAFSPGGTNLLTGTGEEYCAWNVGEWQPGYRIPRDRAGDVVGRMAFAPGRPLLAIARGRDGGLQLLDATQGQRLATLEAPFLQSPMAFTPDASQLLVLAEGGVTQVWDLRLVREQLVALGLDWDSPPFPAPSPVTAQTPISIQVDQQPSQLTGHTAEVRGLAYAPDGRTLVSVSDDGTLKVWETATGRMLHTPEGQRGKVRGVVYARDGSRFASVGEDGTLQLWDSKTHAELKSLGGSPLPVPALAFSPDGQTLAAAGADATIVLWDLAAGQIKTTLKGHTGAVIALQFLPDGKTLASASQDAAVKLWNLATGQARTTLKNDGEIRAAAFSADGQTLAWARIHGWTTPGSVTLWNVELGQMLRLCRGPGQEIRALSFSPDGQVVAAAGTAAEIAVWEVSSGQKRAGLTGNPQGAWGLAFAPDSQRLAAAGGADHTIRLWDVPDPPLQPTGGTPAGPLEIHPQTTLTGQMHEICCLDLSARSGTVLTGDISGGLRIWDLASARQTAVLEGHPARAWCLRESPDGRTLASSGGEKFVTLWDAQTHQKLGTLPEGPQGLSFLEFSPDGKVLAGAGGEGALTLWDLAAKQILKSLPGHRGFVNQVAFSPDGRSLASCGHDDTARLWDVASGECRRVLQAGDGFVQCVAWAPDGRTLATGGYHGAVRLWDPETGLQKRLLRGQTGYLEKLAFSPDGLVVAACSQEDTLRLWSVATGHLRARLTGHVGTVFGVAFARDGRTLVSAGWDQTLRFWDVSPAVQPTPDEAAVAQLQRESQLVVRAARGQLADSERQQLQAQSHPLLTRLADANTRPLLEMYANLPDSSRQELGAQHYLKWSWAALTPAGQRACLDAFRANVGSASPPGEKPAPPISSETLRKAQVGFVEVAIPEPRQTVVSWFAIGPELPQPAWVTVVGAAAADKVPYHKAHTEQVAALAQRPDGPPPAAAAASERTPGGGEMPRGQWQDLLPQFDFELDPRQGSWTRDGQALTVNTAGWPRCELLLPAQSDGDYDLQLDYTSASGISALNVLLPVGGRQCELSLSGFYRNLDGLQLINGLDATQNHTGKERLLPYGQPCSILVQVRLAGDNVTIDVLLDGQPHLHWAGKQAALDKRPWELAPQPGQFGIQAYSTCITFHRVCLRPLSGHATWLPKPAPLATKPVGPAEKLPADKWTELLTRVQPRPDRDGNWRREGDALAVQAPPGGFTSLPLPVVLEGGYEVQLEYTRHSGKEAVCVMFPVGTAHCTLCLAGWGEIDLLQTIDGSDRHNPSTKLSATLEDGRRYAVGLRVRPSGDSLRIDVTLDGQPHLQWTGKAAALGLADQIFAPPPGQLALLVWKSSVTFHQVQVRPDSGQAWLLPGLDRKSDAALPKGVQLALNFEPDTVAQLGRIQCVQDVSGAGQSSLTEGAAAHTPQGQIGGALAVRGGGLRVAGSQLRQRNAYSLAMWINPTKTGRAMDLFTEYDKAGAVFAQLQLLADGQLRFRTRNGRSASDPWVEAAVADTPLAFDRWTFIAVAFSGDGANGGEVTLRIDDKVARHPFRTLDYEDAGGHMRLGAGFVGSVDEFLVCDRALTDEELAALYQRGGK